MPSAGGHGRLVDRDQRARAAPRLHRGDHDRGPRAGHGLRVQARLHGGGGERRDHGRLPDRAPRSARRHVRPRRAARLRRVLRQGLERH